MCKKCQRKQYCGDPLFLITKLNNYKKKIYKGLQYQRGINSKHVLIVGHQIHATAEELAKYINISDWDTQFIHDYCEQNNDLMGDVVRGFKNIEGKAWDDNRKKNSHLKFARTILGNNQISGNELIFKFLWERVAFCNFLQVPDIDLGANLGKDKTYRYEMAKKAFKEYMYELVPQPDKIIVWGKNAYPYIASMAENIIDDRYCILKLDSLNPIEVIRINHPSLAGYEFNRRLLERINLFPIKEIW